MHGNPLRRGHSSCPDTSGLLPAVGTRSTVTGHRSAQLFNDLTQTKDLLSRDCHDSILTERTDDFNMYRRIRQQGRSRVLKEWPIGTTLMMKHTHSH